MSEWKFRCGGNAGCYPANPVTLDPASGLPSNFGALDRMRVFRERVYADAFVAALGGPPADAAPYADPPNGYQIALEKRRTP